MTRITMVLLAILCVFASCQKQEVTEIASTDNTQFTAKTFNCSTTTADAAAIQLIDPLGPKSWFNLSFCFSPPIQTTPTPIIYTNGDSLPVTLQIFVNRVFMRTSWQTEKIDEYFYYPCFHPYPTPYTRFPQKPALQNGTFTFPINFKFEKKGSYNKFINYSGQYINDTVLYNYDAYDFGMHSATTNGYAYVRLILKSDK